MPKTNKGCISQTATAAEFNQFINTSGKFLHINGFLAYGRSLACLDFLLLLRITTVILLELVFSVLTAANHQAGKIAQAARTDLACDLTPLHNSFRSTSRVTLHRTSSKEFGGYRQSGGITLCRGRAK